jgi:hypothetical protein
MTIEIATAENLYNIRNDLDADYILTADIDLSGHTNWDPIGESSKPFIGTLDGQDYTISNLTINRDSDHQGLFSQTVDSEIRNLNFENVSINAGEGIYNGVLTGEAAENPIGNLFENINIKSGLIIGSDYTAGLVGGGYNTQIKNCKVSCEVKGTEIPSPGYKYLAGIIGDHYGGGYIEDCEFTGDLTIGNNRGYYCGGIVGDFHGEYISNCSVTTNITGTVLTNSGGVVGFADICNIDNISFSGNIEITEELSSFGGLVGGMSEVTASSLYINNCTINSFEANGVGGAFHFVDNSTINELAVNNISITNPNGSNTNIAGISTYSTGENTYNNCYVTGYIEGYDYLGGFTTYIYDNDIFNNCYSAVELVALTGDSPNYKGFGLIRDENYTINYTINNCYWDSEITTASDETTAIASTTAVMKNETNYNNWDFDNIWGISPDLNDGYPVLRAFYAPTDFVTTLNIKFIETPDLTIKEVKANRVIVNSPTDSYTAEYSDISQDNIIEKQVEIEEGNINVCKQIADSLLSEWNRKEISITGKVKLNLGLMFEKKSYIIIPDGKIAGNYKIQKLSHNIDDYTTTFIAGDKLLSESEIIARVLNKMTYKL